MTETSVPDEVDLEGEKVLLERMEKLAKVFSLIAIPVAIAWGGWVVQKEIQDQAIRRDYVQLAISILREPKDSNFPDELRGWAVDLLDKSSPIVTRS